MKLLNLSAEPLWKLHTWIPHGLAAEALVFFPDACPGKSPLPTGTAVLTRQSDWRRFAVSDCGCGMRLIRSDRKLGDLTMEKWEELAERLRANKGKMGDLGGGNHFLDAVAPVGGDALHFLIHTGSRNESGHVDVLIDKPKEFDAEFDRVVGWAVDNRAKIHAEIEAVFGKTKLVLDMPHNTYEALPAGGAIIRKGSVRVAAGELMVIPSHMSGDILLAKGTERLTETLHSMSHGTGRAMSRGDSKPLADKFDFAELRRKILIPESIDDSSLRTDGPYAYRDLDDCMLLIDGYVEPVERFRVVGYMGHL